MLSVQRSAPSGAADREPARAPLFGADAFAAGGAAAEAVAPVPDGKAQAFWRGKLATANYRVGCAHAVGAT